MNHLVYYMTKDENLFWTKDFDFCPKIGEIVIIPNDPRKFLVKIIYHSLPEYTEGKFITSCIMEEVVYKSSEEKAEVPEWSSVRIE